VPVVRGLFYDPAENAGGSGEGRIAIRSFCLARRAIGIAQALLVAWEPA
jgi:hypothetical protein